MDSQRSIESTVNDFKNEFNQFFDEKMTTSKQELTNWIVTKLREKLDANLKYLNDLDEEYYRMKDEIEKLKDEIEKLKGHRGGSLKKKENDNKLTKKKLMKKRQKQRGRTRRRKYF